MNPMVWGQGKSSLLALIEHGTIDFFWERNENSSPYSKLACAHKVNNKQLNIKWDKPAQVKQPLKLSILK